MITTLILGLLAGIGMVIYRGLYFGPWAAALNTIGVCVIAAVVIYIALQIIASIGSFFLRILLIIAFAFGILFGGYHLWNSANPTQKLPAIHVNVNTNSFTQQIRNWLHKMGI